MLTLLRSGFRKRTYVEKEDEKNRSVVRYHGLLDVANVVLPASVGRARKRKGSDLNW